MYIHDVMLIVVVSSLSEVEATVGTHVKDDNVVLTLLFHFHHHPSEGTTWCVCVRVCGKHSSRHNICNTFGGGGIIINVNLCIYTHKCQKTRNNFQFYPFAVLLKAYT